MKSYMANGETVERSWYVVDATDMVLGRLSSQVAAILRGKHKPIYTPHVDCGDHVIIVNADKVVLTGKKLDDKKYVHHTGYPGGLKEVSYRHLLAEKPEFAVYESIR
ncbi:MAG: 50S ribosomal protein L13, partial [Clostridia bacterium]|nr:50S ribosomal protein L13 [Clostridia bacterium]